MTKVDTTHVEQLRDAQAESLIKQDFFRTGNMINSTFVKAGKFAVQGGTRALGWSIQNGPVKCELFITVPPNSGPVAQDEIDAFLEFAGWRIKRLLELPPTSKIVNWAAVVVDDDMNAKLKERVLDDDYPVYAGYAYVVDGTPKISVISGTVATLKADQNAKEIKNCDLTGRNLL